MSLFDFFFPDQAQATHLRSIANSARRKNRRSSSQSGELQRRVANLEKDLGYVSLVLGALLQKVDEKGVLTRTEVREALTELDEIDGVKDGQLNIDILRGMGS